MHSTPLAILMIFFQFATGAPPLSSREVFPEVYIDDNDFILSPTLLMTVLVVTAAVILALLAWALHFYLSQV